MGKILMCTAVSIFIGITPFQAKGDDGSEYDKGKTLYTDKCQFCHGMRGDGKGPAAEPLLRHPVDFTDSKFWQGNAAIKIEDTIKNGKEMMPAFDLTSPDIKAIIGYMSHTFKKSNSHNNRGRDEK